MKITLSKAVIAIASAVGTAAAAQNLRGPAFPFPSSSSKQTLSGHVSRQLSVPGWEWTQAPGQDAHDIGCGGGVLSTGIIDKGTDGNGTYSLSGTIDLDAIDPPPTWSEFPFAPTPAGVNIDSNFFRVVTDDGNGNLYEITRNTTTGWAVKPDIYATDVGVSMASVYGMGRVCVIGEILPGYAGNGYPYCESLSTPGEFDQLPGHGVRIAVKSNGTPVLVNTQGSLYSFNGSQWNQIANGYDFIDVAVGPNDVIWAVTRSNEVVAILDTSIILEYGILDLDSTTIFPIENSPPGAKRISVDWQGNPWVVTEPNGLVHKGEPKNLFN